MKNIKISFYEQNADNIVKNEVTMQLLIQFDKADILDDRSRNILHEIFNQRLEGIAEELKQKLNDHSRNHLLQSS